MIKYSEISKVQEVIDFQEVNSLLKNKWVLLNVLNGIVNNNPAFIYTLGYPYSALEDDALEAEMEMQQKYR